MDADKLLKKIDLAIKQLNAARRELMQDAPEIPASIADEEAKGICHFCKEPIGDEVPIRGCHEKCNQRMNRAKKDGEVTDAELIQQGRIGPRKLGGRKKVPLSDYVPTQQVADAEVLKDVSTSQRKRQRKDSST